MIKVTVLYPNANSHFDLPYYLNTHIPMIRQKLAPALRAVQVEQGLAGGAPGTPPPYSMICHLAFDSVEAFQEVWGPHAQAIVGDIPNYTNATPTVQISEVKL